MLSPRADENDDLGQLRFISILWQINVDSDSGLVDG